MTFGMENFQFRLISFLLFGCVNVSLGMAMSAMYVFVMKRFTQTDTLLSTAMSTGKRGKHTSIGESWAKLLVQLS